MDVANVLNNIELPVVYYREGKSCYYDTYRKKLIEITPEETVRQRVAALFEQCFHVPKKMLSLEVPMSYYVDGASGRADIIIHSLDEDSNTLYASAILPEAISAGGLTPPLIQACFSPPIEVGVISQLIYIVNKERCICYARYTRG